MEYGPRCGMRLRRARKKYGEVIHGGAWVLASKVIYIYKTPKQDLTHRRIRKKKRQWHHQWLKTTDDLFHDLPPTGILNLPSFVKEGMSAIIPALMIAGLYFFDHNVASQLAQQKEFNLKNPSAYHYDILLHGFMTLLNILLGLPPLNGVLPQSPMHTKSLVVLKKQVPKKRKHTKVY
ncbi:boron transporter 4-like protein [Tanacetum coccineum]